MKKKTKAKRVRINPPKIQLPKVIRSLTIHGNKVIFTEDSDGLIDYWMCHRVSEELYDIITGYMIDEGIMEEIYGKEYIDSILNEESGDEYA